MSPTDRREGENRSERAGTRRPAPPLAGQQRDFAGALLDPASATGAARHLAGDADRIARGLAVYRDNLASTTRRALGAAYPVIQQVLGATRFETLVDVCRREAPSRHGDITFWGADAAALLSSRAEFADLPYLPDLARLEWAAHLAYGAADLPALDATALAALDAAALADFRLAWAPGCALQRSAYPIVRIWTLHQADDGTERDYRVDWHVAETAWVARTAGRVTVTALAPGEAAFIEASQRGAPLGAALEPAGAADSGFDLGRLLARALAGGWLAAAPPAPSFPTDALP